MREGASGCWIFSQLKRTCISWSGRGKRLPVYRYLREVWQKEPPSEGLTVLALQQMVDYVEYVDDLTVLGEPWEAENEYDLYQEFLLDVIS